MSKYEPQLQPDGTTITYEQVTSRLRDTYGKLVKLGRQAAIARKFNPDYWFLIEDLRGTKQAADYCVVQMKLCARGFTPLSSVSPPTNKKGEQNE